MQLDIGLQICCQLQSHSLTPSVAKWNRVIVLIEYVCYRLKLILCIKLYMFFWDMSNNFSAHSNSLHSQLTDASPQICWYFQLLFCAILRMWFVCKSIIKTVFCVIWPDSIMMILDEHNAIADFATMIWCVYFWKFALCITCRKLIRKLVTVL